MRFPWTKDDTPSNTKSADLADWPWTGGPPPPEMLAMGFGLGDRQAVGLPAFFSVQRLISHSVGMVPTMVLRSGGDGILEEARDSWQWELLANGAPGNLPFSIKADAAASIVGHGNAYLRKIKVGELRGRPRVADLIVMDATKVTPVRTKGRIVYEVRGDDGQTQTLSSDDVIHVRTYATRGDCEGVAPITAARQAIVAGLQRQSFELSHFKRGARSDLVISFPQNVDKDQAERWLELWNAQHQGGGKQGGASVMGGGAEFKIVPISMADAQFVEATKLTTRQIANIYQVPPSFFDGTPGERDWLFFTTFAVGPIITALDQALANDLDLFPPSDKLTALHKPEALLRMDVPMKYQAYKAARQGGWKTPNEIRREENLPPVEGGDSIQVTPVGGAVNPGDPAAATDSAGMDYEELVDAVVQLQSRLKAAEMDLETKQPRTADGRFSFGGSGGSSGSGGGGGSSTGTGDAELKAAREKGAKQAADSLKENGGFSLRGDDLGSANPDGFVVSVAGSEKVLPDLKSATPGAILSYHDANATKLAADKSLMVGGWHDTTSGKVYLDMSKKFNSRDEAIAFGKKNGQLAIWDGKAGKEIRLDNKSAALSAEQQIAKLRAQNSNPVQFPLGQTPAE